MYAVFARLAKEAGKRPGRKGERKGDLVLLLLFLLDLRVVINQSID